MMRKTLLFLLIGMLVGHAVSGQTKVVDSLKQQLNLAKTAEATARLTNQLSIELLSADRDASKQYAEQSIEISRENKIPHWLASSLIRKGQVYSRSGDDSTALVFFRQALGVKLSSKYDTIYADAKWQIGSCYYHFSNYDSALVYFFESLDVYKPYASKSIKKHTASVLNNIGNVYYFTDPERAIKYYLESLELYHQLDDTSGRASQTGNIGLIYIDRKDTAKAISFSEQSLALYQAYVGKNMVEQKRKRNIATSQINLAYAHMTFGNYEKALDYANQSLLLRKEIDNPKGIAISTDIIGTIYYKMRLFSEAISYLESSSRMLHEQHLRSYEAETLKTLAECYAKVGRFREATDLYPRAFELLDTIYKEESTELIGKVEGLYQTEKDNKVALMEREAEINELQLKKRESYLLTATVVTFLLGIMSLILFFFYRIRTKANVALEKKNNEISIQKELIEEKNKHITDSITYAERLQSAILPKEETFNKHFSNHTILFKPKDIVSGDFYWMEEAAGLVFLAAADCTGHGVPGAMVSMVGFQGLNKAVLEEKLTSPAAILQRLSDYVEEAFEKSGGSVKDGMDICLVAIDTKKRTVTYSGAHNALWILTSKEELPNANLREEEDGKRMFELKADRRSIGGFMDAGSFTETTVELNQGDRLFLFSDGFADQFGGPQGKKLGSKRMRETARQMSVSGNLATLGAIFQDWKGEEEQVDDVTVISVAI